jgi:iron(III) transport system substrate-binding protein
MRRRWIPLAALAAAAAVAVAGCGADEESAPPAAQPPAEAPTPAEAPPAPPTSPAPAETAEGGSLTVYSGREEEIVAPLFERFEQETGIEVEVRYGNSAELVATLAEEGGSSPADVVFLQDAGSLGAAAAEGLLAPLPQATLDRVGAAYRDPEGRWVGTSGRARVVAYNTDLVAETDLPASIYDLADPRWQGKVGVAPTNGSFQAFVTALRLDAGDERARQWLEELKANEPKTYESNSQILEAVAAGEVEVGLVNHYYLPLLKQEQPEAPVENHFLAPGDPGALVNVAGAGIVEGGEHADEAQRFVEFLLSDAGQQFYAEEAAESEYPLVAGVPAAPGLPPLEELQGPDIALGDLGPELENTLVLLNEVGFTS